MATTKTKLCQSVRDGGGDGHVCICSNADWHPAAAALFNAPGMARHACDCGDSWKDAS